MIVVGSMIGSGNFHYFGGVGAAGGGAGLVAGRLGAGRRAHNHRRALLRRAGGNDAARRRAVRLLARSLWSSGRIPFRLVPAAGHSNRHHRRGRSCFCTLHGRARAAGLRVKLHYCAGTSFWQLRH